MFEQMHDYPVVEVESVEILPIPEAVDLHSSEAAVRWTTLSREEEPAELRHGINLTPEVAEAASRLEAYFASLRSQAGKALRPELLDPPLERDANFRWAYRIPQSTLLISMQDRDDQEGLCEVLIHGPGPNLGSAGGPTLQRFGALAAVYYRRRLTGPCREQYGTTE
jgi:hypothetical protein